MTSNVPGHYDVGDISIALKPNRQGWAVVTLTAVDGPRLDPICALQAAMDGYQVTTLEEALPLTDILVTATGDAENTGMRWKDGTRTSVGADWGRRPSLVEGIPATITLPAPRDKVRAWPLDERGRRRDALGVSGDARSTAVTIGPASKTVWYEVEIGP